MPTAQGHSDIDDRDLIAIRNLLAQNGVAASNENLPSDATPKNAVRTSERSDASAPPVAPNVVQGGPASHDRPIPLSDGRSSTGTASGGRVAALRTSALRRVRAYRPRVKVVLGTSLVLLFLLHPVSMIGWTVVISIFGLAVYLIVDEEKFWRAVLSLHGRYGRINPAAARSLGVRARIAARKWNRWVRFLPQGMADSLQTPDVGSLTRAEARHDAALMDRLNRLDRD